MQAVFLETERLILEAVKELIPERPIFDINQCHSKLSFTTTFHHTEQTYMNSLYAVALLDVVANDVTKQDMLKLRK